MVNQQKKLQSNIWKFSLYYITHRRIYWPLLTVYFLSFPDNTAQQVGLFLAIGQIGGFIFEIPSGYISDKIGHKQALILSKILLLASTTLFVIGGNVYIFSLGAILFTAGFAFNSGTFGAFTHEVLSALKKDHQYSKIIGSIRSKSFIVSAILLAALPFTVAINFKLPFIIALFFDFIGLLITLSFVVPRQTKFQVEEINKTNFKAVFKEGRVLRFYPIAIVMGLITSIIISCGAYRDVYQQFLGINIIYLGIFMALSRLISSATSRYIYKIYHKLSAQAYLLIIIIVYSLIIFSIGYIQNIWYVVTAFIILVGSLWGSTSLFDHYKLDYIKTSHFKATLLSIGGLSLNLFAFFTNLIIAFLIGRYLYSLGYMYFGGVSFIILMAAYFIFIRFGLPKNKWVKNS